MDRAVASKRSNSKRLQRLQKVAWRGATEMLEKRMMLSSALTNAQPLFIQNAGQWNDPSIKFALQTTAGSILMTDHGPVFNVYQQLSGASAHEQFSVHFDGADVVTPTGSNRGGAFNYLSAGVMNVKSYKTINYSNLYNGIDLQTTGQRDNLKYEFHVDPGADHGQVQISYDGIQGLSIDSKGRLHIKTKLGELIDDAPIVYQTINGKRVVIESAFKLIDSNTYSFDVKGDFDPTKELVLDPSINWGTYFGGAAADTGDSIAVDGAGNIYITGSTNSTDFPLRGALDPEKTGNNATDAYITKLDVDGDLVWSTYFGGNAADAGRGIRLSADASRVFVAGTTSSSDVTFPSVVGAAWATGNAYNGGNDAFVAVLTSGGSLSFAGYFGGAGAETVTDVAVDSADNFYITGSTGSGTDFPFINNGNFQQAKGTGNDAYIAKFDTAISSRSLLWASWFGGNADDLGQGIAVTDDHVYLVGDTTSTIMDATIEAVNIGLPDEGGRDAFILSIFDPQGSGAQPSLEWFRYMGGEGADTAAGVTVNSAGTIAVTGNTASDTTFPALLYQGADGILGGANDAYLALYTPSGQEKFVTYVGGGAADTGNALLVDFEDNFVLIGTSSSTDLPVQNDAGGQFQNRGGSDAMYGIFDDDGDKLVLDLYGGNGADTGLEGAVNSDGGLYIVGTTASTDLNQGVVVTPPLGEPVTLPRTNRGANDAYVVFLALDPLAAAPEAPINLSAQALPDGSVRLTWGDPSLINEGFNVYRSTSKTAQLRSYTRITQITNGFATSHTDTTTLPGVTYYYYVTSYRGALERASNRASVTTGSSAVAAPTGLQATAISGTRIDLKWTDNSTNETGFEIWRQETATNEWRRIFITGKEVTTFTDPTPTSDNRVDQPVAPLQPGTEYAYRVRAFNSIRVSTFTDPRIVSTKSGSFIVAPSSLNAARTGANTVVLSWQDNSNNELGFVVERAPFGTTNFSALTPTTAANATSFVDNTATGGQVYIYRVKAINGGVSSAYSNLATSDLDQALLRPTRFEALANSATQIKLTWRDNSTIESGFVIERAQSEPNDWTVIGTAPVNATSFYDKRAVSGKRYYYRIRSTDGTNFSGYSANATERALPRFVTAPRAPTDLRGKLLSNTSIRLVWRDNAIDETSYSIERSTSLDGGFTSVGRTDVNVNQFIDSGLIANKTYYYRVRAMNGGIRSSTTNILKIKASLATAAKTKALKLAELQSPPPVKTVFNTGKLVSDDSVLSQL